MEDSKKKPIMIGIIIVCLTIAAVVFIKTHSQGSDFTPVKGLKIWLKCTNEACGAEYEIELQKYQELMSEQGGLPPMNMMQAPVLVCEKCGKKSAYVAEKCRKCGTVYIMDNSGKCPKCGFDGSEDEQNAAAEKKG